MNIPTDWPSLKIGELLSIQVRTTSTDTLIKIFEVGEPERLCSLGIVEKLYNGWTIVCVESVTLEKIKFLVTFKEYQSIKAEIMRQSPEIPTFIN